MSDHADRPQLFTIGHSDHELPHFLALLAEHRITAVADVRSHPYSRFHPQYNREALIDALDAIDIKYVFLGRELGARRSEPEGYERNRARYDLVRRLPAFQEGLARLRNGIHSNQIALLCAERDPLTCHRAILICRELRSDPIEILHIREDGSIEGTADAEARLLQLCGLPDADLFSDRSELIEQAYEKQSERIAYTADESSREHDGISLERSNLHHRVR